jgi:hypothetical protein
MKRNQRSSESSWLAGFVTDVAQRYSSEHNLTITPQATVALLKPAASHARRIQDDIEKGVVSEDFIRGVLVEILTLARPAARYRRNRHRQGLVLTRGAVELALQKMKCRYFPWC